MNKLLIIFYLATSVLGLGQDKDKVLSPRQMREDVDSLYSWYKDAHPDPFVTLDERTFDNTIDSLKNTLNRNMTKAQFYTAIAGLQRYFDLHSHIGYSKRMYKEMKGDYPLPRFEEEGGKVFFNLGGARCELLRVNGTTPCQVESNFEAYDNILEPSKNHNFLDALLAYLARNVYFDKLTLAYRSGGKEDSVSYSRVEPSRKALRTSKNMNDKRLRETFFVYDTVRNAALLEINTFFPRMISFSKVLDDYFDTLEWKHIDTVFVDITRNRGGLVMTEERTASYFIPEGEHRAGSIIWKQSRTLKRKRKFNFLNVETEGDMVKLLGTQNGTFRHKEEYISSRATDRKYRGKVFVVQSRHSYSAATLFAAHLKEFAHATVIGEEGQVKAMFANPLMLPLPNSKLLFTVSSMFIKGAGAGRRNGVVPDIPYHMYDTDEEFTIEQLLKIIHQNKIIN